MRSIRVTSVFLGFILLLSVMVPIMAPESVVADGGGSNPPIELPPPDTLEGSAPPPEEDPSNSLGAQENLSWLDLVLIQFSLIL